MNLNLENAYSIHFCAFSRTVKSKLGSLAVKGMGLCPGVAVQRQERALAPMKY